jgi:hypothetical protein
MDYESPLVDKHLKGAEERALTERIAPERRRSTAHSLEEEAGDVREEMLLIAGSIMGLSVRPWININDSERKTLLRAGELLLDIAGASDQSPRGKGFNQ